jgi:hypothetical protein
MYSPSKLRACLAAQGLGYSEPVAAREVHPQWGATVTDEIMVDAVGATSDLAGANVVFERTPALAIRARAGFEKDILKDVTAFYNPTSPYALGEKTPRAALIGSLEETTGNVDILWDYPPSPTRASKAYMATCLATSRIRG